MDSQALVTEQIDAAGRIIDRLGRSIPLVAAFWVKPADGRRWALYLASDWADRPNGFARVAAELYAAGDEHAWGDRGLPFRVVSPDAPAVRAVLDLHRRYPELIPMWYSAPMLGDLGIDDSYLYPLPAPAAVAA